MRKILGLFAALFLTSAAHAQGVTQTGTVTAGHAVRWVGNGLVGDAGTAANGFITSLGIVNNGGNGLCVQSAASTATGYNQLCLAVSTAAAAQISLQNFGTATAQTLNFVINGVSYPFPGSLSAIVVGSTAVTGGSNGACLYDNNGVVGAQSCVTGAITQLTGDVSAVGPGVAAATLATVNVNVGTFGSGTQIPVITVDGKGRITAAANTTLTAAANDLSGTTLASNVVNSSLTSVGALSSGSLASGFTVVTGALGGTGVANTGKTVTLGGSLTTAGAFDSTFTMTGATNVTFPTSGTLATTTGANVATVSNSDGTLTISPTSGAVVASLALGHANTWSGQQTFTNNLAAILGSSTGYTALGSANASATNYIATFPANTGTVAELNLAQSWTATQTLQTLLAGTTNTYDIGTSASVSAFRTIYAGTSFVGPLVNATTGFQVNGAATSTQYLRGNGTNFVSSAIQAGDLPVVSDASGSPSATFGAMKCDGTTTTCTSGVVTAVGGVATSVQIGVTTVTSGVSGNIIYNNAGVLGETTPGNGVAISSGTLGLTAARRTLPTTQILTSGTGATYTTPANALWLEVYACGGGGGGSGSNSGTTAVAGSNGSTTTFNSINAAGGGGGSASASPAVPPVGGTGGTGGTGTATQRFPGAPGYQGSNNASVAIASGGGGTALLGGGGAPGLQPSVAAGTSAAANSGAGGGGAFNNGGTNNVGGAGGGGGECFYLLINSPAATYTYTIGAGGAGGVATNNGGDGGSGVIKVIEHYGT